MTSTVDPMDGNDALARVQAELESLRDPKRAIAMAAYMKTDMPFYGVPSPGLAPVLKMLLAELPANDRSTYTSTVEALWAMPHREEKHLAIRYARSFPSFIDAVSIPLFHRLIVEGAWWDLVDESAVRLVGRALRNERPLVEPIVRSWITDEDLWLRRTTIICQLAEKAGTDPALLEDACLANLGDSEFFIRKAVGWALRQYARTDPEWVRAFVDRHRDEMSGLSVREATKYL